MRACRTSVICDGQRPREVRDARQCAQERAAVVHHVVVHVAEERRGHDVDARAANGARAVEARFGAAHLAQVPDAHIDLVLEERQQAVHVQVHRVAI